MIRLEDIKIWSENLSFSQLEMQRKFVFSAVNHTAEHLEKYKGLFQSFGGRYISSDLFKETFDEYCESFKTRCEYDLVIHNSAAVLSNELFCEMADCSDITDCIFLCGVPGAGKSFLIQSLLNDNLIDSSVMIFEGNISALEKIKVKIDRLLASNKRIHILVVNPTLELAISNTIERFNSIGRGTSIEVMAEIMSSIPFSLLELYKIYGSQLELGIYHKKSNQEIIIEDGWKNLSKLVVGTKEEILTKIYAFIEQKRLEGEVNDEYYAQATAVRK